jgi:hypothetical protein
VFRPAAGVVIYAQDLQDLVVYSVGDDAGRFGDDEFARAGRAARIAELRVTAGSGFLKGCKPCEHVAEAAVQNRVELE